MPQDSPSRHLDQYLVRFPDGLRDRIKAYAAANKRSMNAEIIALIEFGLWHEDQARMMSGLEPFREMTDKDREFMENYHRPPSSPSSQPSQAGDLPFLDDDDDFSAELEALANRFAKDIVKKTLTLKRPGKAPEPSTEKPAGESRLGPIRLTGRLGNRKMKLDDEGK